MSYEYDQKWLRVQVDEPLFAQLPGDYKSRQEVVNKLLHWAICWDLFDPTGWSEEDHVQSRIRYFREEAERLQKLVDRFSQDLFVLRGELNVQKDHCDKAVADWQNSLELLDEQADQVQRLQKDLENLKKDNKSAYGERNNLIDKWEEEERLRRKFEARYNEQRIMARALMNFINDMGVREEMLDD